MTISQTEKSKVVLVQKSDLSASGTIACPNPALDMPQWASHPLIYLQFDDTGQATCPYCGTIYQLAPND